MCVQSTGMLCSILAVNSVQEAAGCQLARTLNIRRQNYAQAPSAVQYRVNFDGCCTHPNVSHAPKSACTTYSLAIHILAEPDCGLPASGGPRWDMCIISSCIDGSCKLQLRQEGPTRGICGVLLRQEGFCMHLAARKSIVCWIRPDSDSDSLNPDVYPWKTLVLLLCPFGHAQLSLVCRMASLKNAPQTQCQHAE